jgi:hypothetical protein
VELFEQIRREYRFGVGTGCGKATGSTSADSSAGAGERGSGLEPKVQVRATARLGAGD